MIVVDDCVLAHIPRTGGRAARAYIAAVSPLRVSYWSMRCEHHLPFCYAKVDLQGCRRVLGLRRLSSWYPSALYWIAELSPANDLRLAKGATAKGLADLLLSPFLADGEPDVWLRQEHLLDDLTAWLGWSEKDRLVATAASPVWSDRDSPGYRPLSPGQAAQIYADNPLWAAAEQRVYGSDLG